MSRFSFLKRLFTRIRTASERAKEQASKAQITSRFGRLHTRIHYYQTHTLQFVKEISNYRVVRLFRRYSAFSIVASSALLVSASNFTQGKDSQSLLFGYMNDQGTTSDSLGAPKLLAQAYKKENLSLVPLVSASNADLSDQKDESSLFDAQNMKGQDAMMFSSQPGASISKDPEEEGGVKIYTVETGDTISSIAVKYGITVNTILWANDLGNVDEIKPGDQLFILPVAGISYAVKEGDSIDDIAKKYQADKEKIIAFNDLPANGELQSGDVIIIPDGKKDEVPKPNSDTNGLERRQYANSSGGAATDLSSGFRDLTGRAGSGHSFPYGYCTWYVAQKRYVPWGGNAGTWLYNAKTLGYRTGKAPAIGAIMVTTENRYFGHVALVEKISDGIITVSEMNYNAWGKVDRRTLPVSSRFIKGFIY